MPRAAEGEQQSLLSKSHGLLRERSQLAIPATILGMCAASLAVWSLANSHSTRANTFSPGEEVSDKWAPSSEDEVLPKKEWAKTWHVQHPNSSLGRKRYYQYSHHPAFVRLKADSESLLQWQIARDCPKQSIGMDMLTTKDLPILPDVKAAGVCQKICTETPECEAWVWGSKRNKSDFTDVCWRKAFRGPFEEVRPVVNADVIGGLPCLRQPLNRTMWWPKEEMEFFDMPREPEHRPSNLIRTKMLCIAVFLPYTYEQDLLLMQYRLGTGIFACDSHVIYSSARLELTPGLVSRQVSSTLMSELGGPYITVLNLGAFMAVWRQVLLDGDYLGCDWTIKADPDTVFIAQRLVPILDLHSIGMDSSGKYLNNCQDGLHGPLEIFSQGALLSLGREAKSCARALDGGKECDKNCDKFWDFNYKEKCNGPCTMWWGEDIWLDQCLSRFAQVTRVFVPELLQEDHCHPRPGWRDCLDTGTVAFHPFKSVHEYLTCLEATLDRSILL
mmetsp:Transcript_50687/g.94677  ORF Transcript_50687/g.94677 Transcript_50687/m.94677 type:complete len:501 (-) Transcript_50687:121-1623(-)